MLGLFLSNYSSDRACNYWIAMFPVFGVTCLVHELAVDDTAHTRMIAALRYLDSLVKKDGKWFIRQRQVAVDWIETRPLATG